MIVVVDTITRKEAVELGHIEIEIKVLLEYLFELSSKSKTLSILSSSKIGELSCINLKSFFSFFMVYRREVSTISHILCTQLSFFLLQPSEFL
jgi:hypothetical protein